MYFANVSEISELKGQYRRLAARFHPDRGGCPTLMTRINVEYEELLASLKSGQAPVRRRAYQPPPRQERRRERRRRGFQDVQVGQVLYVNGTPCEVLEVTRDAFRAVAIGRTRQTWFNKSNGYGRYNKRFRAAWVEHNRRLH